jgi:hypothetical protein
VLDLPQGNLAVESVEGLQFCDPTKLRLQLEGSEIVQCVPSRILDAVSQSVTEPDEQRCTYWVPELDVEHILDPVPDILPTQSHIFNVPSDMTTLIAPDPFYIALSNPSESSFQPGDSFFDQDSSHWKNSPSDENLSATEDFQSMNNNFLGYPENDFFSNLHCSSEESQASSYPTSLETAASPCQVPPSPRVANAIHSVREPIGQYGQPCSCKICSREFASSMQLR